MPGPQSPSGLKLGLIGFGAIGRQVAAALADDPGTGIAVRAILVRRSRPGGAPPGTLLTADPERFFADRLDTVLECAGHAALARHGARALAAGADLLVTSVGALADPDLLDSLLAAATAARRRLILPSAGIGALDILSAAAVGGLDAVEVTVRKDPLSWKATIAETIADLDGLDRPLVLYEGSVREGARLYPENVNISAAAALAGIGLDRTRLRIVADPAIRTHIVELEARGAFGRFHFREEVIPTAENPKTGRLVAMALVKTLRQLTATLVVGA